MRMMKLFFLLLGLGCCCQKGISDEHKKLKIGFFLEHLTVRGTEVATFNYADFNEKILGNESIIVFVNFYPGEFVGESPASVREYFTTRFKDKFYECDTLEEMDQILSKEKVDFLYLMKGGHLDGKLSKVTKNAVHAVFPGFKIHGDVCGTISQWLSEAHEIPNVPYVPYMVCLDDTTETLHEELDIPKRSVVFGRHGGFDSFDVAFAMEAVVQTAKANKDWYFLFLNTRKFCDLPNVIFLPATGDLVYKTKFINTCDAMIHARKMGESYGLACAEFSIRNKPVITWTADYHPDYHKSHLEILGEKGLFYDDKLGLLNVLSWVGDNIDEVRSSSWDAYSEKYNPRAVMKQFHDVFITPLTGL